MEQIAMVHVLRGTRYNHFPVREAIVVHWLRAQLDQALMALMDEAVLRPAFIAMAATLLDASKTWWARAR